MADNELPIQITVSVNKADVEREIGVAFSSVKKKAEEAGREIGESMAKAMTSERRIDRQNLADKYFKDGVDKAKQYQIQERRDLQTHQERTRELLRINNIQQNRDYSTFLDQWRESRRKSQIQERRDAEEHFAKINAARKQQELIERRDLESQRIRWAAEKRSLGSGVGNKNLMSAMMAGSDDATRRMGVLISQAQEMNKQIDKQNGYWYGVGQRMEKIALLTTQLTRAFFGLTAVTATVGLPAIISTQYLSTIEDAKLGIAGTLQAISEASGAGNQWSQSMQMSEQVLTQLTNAAVKYNISLDEIADTFRGIVGVGSAAGMTLQEVGRIATIGTMAVKSLNLNKTQTLQEIRDLVQPGGIQAASSTLATALNITNEMTKKWKEAGTLFENLEKRMAGYTMAALERQNTLSGALDILKMKLQRLFASPEGFDVFKKVIQDISSAIGEINYETGEIKFNPELVELMKSYWNQIMAVAKAVGMVAEAAIYLAPKLWDIATVFGVWYTSAKVLPLIYTGMTAISGAVAALPALFGSASAAMMTLGVTASAVGTRMAALSAGAAGGVIGLALFGTYLLADYVGLVDQIFSSAEGRAKSFRDKIKGYDVEQLQFRKMRIEGSIEYIEQEQKTNVLPRRYDIDGIKMFGEEALKQLKSNLRDTEHQIKKTIEANEKLAANSIIQQGNLAEAASKDLESKNNDTVKRAAAVEAANKRLKETLSGIGTFIQVKGIKEGTEEYETQRKRMVAATVRYNREIEEANKIGVKKNKSIQQETKDALKDALTAENIFAEKQDTLVREGAKTYIEAYNDKIAKIKEFAEKNGESIKWEERRNEAYKTVSDYLTQHNAQLNKESEQREANTTATLKYGAAVETSGAALLMEQYAREGFLESGFKELALINVLAQSRNDLSKIHEKSVKEQIDSQKELDELVAESSLIFLENEKQKSEFKMQETLKRINAEREEAKKSLELNLKLRMSAGPLSPQEYENYLETKEAINKSFMDREETTRNIFNQRVKNAELKDAKETVDKIEGTFKEAFMNIAENGVSGWRGMLDKFKSDFKKNIIEYIYKELAKPFVLNVITQVTGAMGMSGVSQAASSMARATGAGSSIYNAYSAGSSIMGAAGQGLYGTAYGQFATSGLGTALGLSHPASLMGPTVTGEALGGLTTLGTALPYVTAALVIADAVGLFGEGGGPQQGQYGSLGSEGYKSSFTMSGGDALGNQALAEVAYGQAATLLKMAGKDITGLTIGQGYKLDPEGSAAGLAYRNISLNGRTITGGTFDGNNGAQWVGGSGDAEGAATYLAKLTSSEIEAIANTLNDAKLNGIIASLKKDFDDLADGMARYQTAQALQEGFLGAILSDEEKQKRHLAEVTEYLNKAFADINMAVPTTTEEFRKLIDGVDLTTVAGQTLLTQLGAMGDSFLFVVERAKAAQAQQEEYTNRLAVLQGTTTEQRLAREKELAGALTDGNKAILNQIYALEDHNAIIEKQKEAYQSLSETITTMVDAIKAQNGALKASQSGWQREYGGVDVQGAAERVAAAMGMSVGSVRGMSEADLRSLALSQSQTTTTTDKYVDVSKEAMTEALRSGFMATSDALADAVRGGVLFDKLPALLDPFLKPLALNTDDAFQYVANHILSSWDAIMGDGGSGAGKTLAEIVDQFVQGQDLPTSHRVLAGKETTSNFDKLKQDWDDLIAAAAESAKAGAEAAGRMAEEAKKAADAAAAAAKEAEDAFRQLAESVESVFQKYQDNIKKSRIDGMTSQEKVSYFTNQSAQALAALSGGTIQDSETLLKLHDDYIESVMNQYDVELEALEEQFKVTTDLLQTVVDIKGWLDKIKLGTLSTLSPLQKLEESRRQYETTLAAAQGGDIAARQNLTAVAEEYLNQAQSYYASSEDYANIFTNVLTPIEALSEPTKTTAEILAQIEGQDKLFNTQANALRERMIVALETGQNRLVDALGSMKADFIAALGQASALAKAATGVKVSSSDSPELAPELAATVSYNGTSHKVSGGSKEDLVLAAVSSINPGFDYAGAAASNPALIEAWGKDLGIPGYAKGGMANGWSIVGERGPEVVNFAQPTRVYTNEQTQGMFAPVAANENDEEYLKAVIAELQALIRQNGAGTQAVIEELQQVKAELEEIRSKTRMKDAA